MPINENYNFKPEREDWVEVICQSDVNSKLYKDIAFKLISLEYLSPNAYISKGSEDIHKALNNYAKDNNLPYGNLNIPLLQKLGVL